MSQLAIHGTYMANAYDFYKPRLSSEYPEVDGQGSIITYLESLDNCYARFREKSMRDQCSPTGVDSRLQVSLEDFDYHIFHSPYGKLVQKGFARLVGADMIS